MKTLEKLQQLDRQLPEGCWATWYLPDGAKTVRLKYEKQVGLAIEVYLTSITEKKFMQMPMDALVNIGRLFNKKVG